MEGGIPLRFFFFYFPSGLNQIGEERQWEKRIQREGKGKKKKYFDSSIFKKKIKQSLPFEFEEKRNGKKIPT